MTQTDCPEELRGWLTAAVEAEASDLHLVVGHPPVLRVNGALRGLEEPVLEGESLRHVLTPVCPADHMKRLQRHKNIDFSAESDIGGETHRFRVNYFIAGQHLGACFRVIPATIPDFAWAGFPEDIAQRLAGFRYGLVLFSGVTGSGKTTTLAMIISLLNEAGGKRIITVEEPIEYLFPKRPDSIVSQREVGVDVDSFSDGLKYGLRQDPDVMLVGEIRDRETAQMALSAAETGHLVFSTVHSADAKGAISRYADLFPQSVHSEIRSQLSICLRAVISQHLLPSAEEGAKRELALEIMFNDVRNAAAIRFGKLQTIDNNILTSREQGMFNLDESVKRLLHSGRITRETAERYVRDVTYL